MGFDGKRLIQTRCKIFGQRFAGLSADDCGEHIGVHGVIVKRAARLKLHGCIQEVTLPVRPHRGARFIKIRSRAHVQQHPNRHFLRGVRFALRRFVKEDIAEPLVDAQQPFVHQHADGGCGDALAQRIELVRKPAVIGRPTRLGNYPAVSQNHNLLRTGSLVRMDGVQQRDNRAGGDPLLLRRTARKRRGIRPRQTGRLLRAVAIGIKVLGILR
ncbi:hypothetical protein SDC9_165257 [bioreactor metagenome]|uniref:Uncharacterized protein n=1 Tax=bioreactor metagenome TaxID=1076179 RepID=A0A645FW45_9ZZZZ